MSDLLKGVAIVTGGGSGIGQATCIALIQHGVEKLAILDTNVRGMSETRHLVTKITKVDVAEVEVNVADEQAVIRGFEQIIKRFGRIDIAINNAAIAGTISASTSIKLQDFRNVIDVNLTGLWICQREAIRQMLKQDPRPQKTGPSIRGVIVNLSSTYGLVSPPQGLSVPPYVASKHAIIGITKTDANTFAGDGIRINTVCPGFINTPALIEAAKTSELVAKERMKVPMGRFGEPSELAEAICFLASSMSSYMTGSSLVVDGGATSL